MSNTVKIDYFNRSNRDWPWTQWEYDLAIALGYTFDGNAPTAWNLPDGHMFAFIESTNEVVIYEVDGEDTDDPPRRMKLIPHANKPLWRTIRRPLPNGFTIQTITIDDGTTHRIAIRTNTPTTDTTTTAA